MTFQLKVSHDAGEAPSKVAFHHQFRKYAIAVCRRRCQDTGGQQVDIASLIISLRLTSIFPIALLSPMGQDVITSYISCRACARRYRATWAYAISGWPPFPARQARPISQAGSARLRIHTARGVGRRAQTANAADFLPPGSAALRHDHATTISTFRDIFSRSPGQLARRYIHSI